jgi:hypothetical protein
VIKRLGILALVVLGISSAFGQQSSPVAEKAITPKRVITLFNGKNLDNFYTYLKTSKYEDPKKVFTVQDGKIRISGEEFGAVITRDAYRDYHLIVEWKWGGPNHPPREKNARDSGILVHSVGADGAYGGIWMESVECQVIEGGCGDFILVGGAELPSLTVETHVGANGELYWQKGGKPVAMNKGRFDWFGRDPEWKDILGFRGRNDVEKPVVGKWNRSEVICDGDSITNLVNGVVVNQGTHSSHTWGRIQLQSEAAEIWIRRVELRPLK